MTKRDIVIRIAGETGLIQNAVAAVVRKTLDHIADEIAEGRGIELRDFGVFEVKVHKKRKGRNPRKPAKEVTIPERTVVKFSPGMSLKTRVAKLAVPKAAKTRPAGKGGTKASKPAARAKK